MFRPIWHRYIYIIGIITLIWGLSLSPFLISQGQFILAGNWLLEFRFKQKWVQIKKRPYLMFFLFLFLIHVLWLINTSNLPYALRDIKIKLPLLALPLILSSHPPLSLKEIKLVLHMVLLSAITATCISSYVFLGFTDHPAFDPREASLFMSHIRFAILNVISFYILASIILNKTYQYKTISKIYILILIWLFVFIVGLGAFTGIILLISTLPVYYIFWLKSQHNNKMRIFSFLGIGIVFTVVLIIGIGSFIKFNNRNIVNFNLLDKETVNGNKYEHFERDDYENKDLVWIYVCEKELKTEWNKVSEIKINGTDQKGQLIRHTLIRYLTSLGYKKDSVGISLLDKEDIELIEQGYTNHIYKKRFSLYPRLYSLFWEIEQYTKSGDPNNHSLTLRIEYFKNAVNAWKRHVWFGTGTGDINDEIIMQYKQDNSILHEKWQHRSHNQYLSFLLTFGIVGFLALVFSIVIGLWKARRFIDNMALAFLIVMFLSMLAEDTLETQAGASIAGFYLALFLFGRKTNIEYDKEA